MKFRQQFNLDVDLPHNSHFQSESTPKEEYIGEEMIRFIKFSTPTESNRFLNGQMSEENNLIISEMIKIDFSVLENRIWQQIIIVVIDFNTTLNIVFLQIKSKIMSKKDKDFTGFPGDCNQTQLKALSDFRNIGQKGMLQLNKLFEVTTEQRLIKYYIQSYELLLKRIFPACSQTKGTKIEQSFTILDLKGGSMKMVSKQVYNFIQLASNIGQNNYPEILGKMYIVNAPMMFTGIWAMIKIWLDEKTKNKITILGSSYKDELLKHIDIDNLPDFLGGNSKCENTDVLSQNIGPWNPDGTRPLFPVESPPQLEEEFQQQLTQTQEDEDQKQKLDLLKNALADMQFSAPVEKPPHNPNKYEVTTQNNHIVSDTPLNTEVGEEDNQFSQSQQQQLFQQLQQE
ncbi:unnamed protein product [Paramecium pentaurelia]|uniref:CRAL-TRIO domain-containing protein n=1 Tax=Paramecium pentaurelia TaxID=43138 RepID=A0A8S1X5X7_9CILI|nr:unnamed protein product [Paramecium pentaurelia]